MHPGKSTARRRALAALAAVPLMGAMLAAPTAASADPIEDCDFQPLTFTKNYVTGGETWRAKADLKVYDLCDAGTFTGSVYVGTRGDTDFGAIDPFSVKIDYKRQLDQSFRGSDNFAFKKEAVKDRYTPFKVTAEDIDLEPNGGYFMEVRIRYTIDVRGNNTTKTVTCDRIHDKGEDAFLCR